VKGVKGISDEGMCPYGLLHPAAGVLSTESLYTYRVDKNTTLKNLKKHFLEAINYKNRGSGFIYFKISFFEF